ncbi:MAG: EAL domain-containing protein [Ectothiorhodospiraceae bacterium]|nr:EAL domain-containing protein [Ectothiorhodospiraceae bacterium]
MGRQQEPDKHAAESLAGQLHSLLASLPGVAYRCRYDIHWTMLFLIGGCRALTGYVAEDLINNARISFASLIHPEDADRIQQLVDQARARGTSHEFSYRIRTASGETRWVWERGHTVEGPDGETQLEGFITDITEKQRLSQRLDAILEQMPHGFYLLDDAWRISYVNPVAEQLLRRPRERLLGQRVWDVLASDSRDSLLHVFRDAREAQEPRHCEFHLDTMDEWFETHAYPSADGLAVYFRTITDRKHYEKELEITNRALTLLSRCNEALIHAEDEEELLEQICRLAVDIGGYVMAWAGYAREDDYRLIQQMARAGRVEGYLDDIRFSWSDQRPEGRGPAGMAIRTGEPVFLADITQHQPFGPWLDQARQRGYGGLVGLPLKDDDRTFGVLMLYKGHPDPFLPEEKRLLSDLAADVAFGLRARRLQERERKLQQAVIRTAAAVSAQSDTQFFEQMAINMTAAVGADAGFLARLIPGSADRARTIATVFDGKLAPNVTLNLRGTPCQSLLETPELLITDGLMERFPGSRSVRAVNARACAGQRLSGTTGNPLGMLFVLFRDPPEDTAFVQSTLRIFAAGATAELERQGDAARIQKLAYYDETTGLPNRALFLERLQRAMVALREGPGEQQLAVLFMDLNRFKEINDSQGHLTGDQVLREVAARFRARVRRGETLARLGGDEFVFMAPVKGPRDATAMAGRLLDALDSPVRVDGQEFQLEASIGIALAPGHGASPETLLQHTDIAMYQAKASGGGYCLFQPAMAREIAERIDLAKRFAEALRSEALELYYQPQVDMATGRLTGAEALLRWHDPALGWISPARFIPIAEERGMMDEVGDWVIARVCRQLADWRHAGLDMPGRVSVNISAQQLDNRRLAGRLAGIAWSQGVPPQQICLELTETGIMRDPARAVESIEELTAAGFILSIDDFGTGYSSLAHLKRFPVQGLKIDLSFVRDMLVDSNDHAIVNTIIAMARTMGLQTVAEGVETEKQARHLLELGCNEAQGYHFGHPVPADTFAAHWLEPGAPRRQRRPTG